MRACQIESCLSFKHDLYESTTLQLVPSHLVCRRPTHTVLSNAIQPYVFAVITFTINDLRERLSLHDGFTEGWAKKINYEKFPLTGTVALFSHFDIRYFWL